MNKSFSNGSLKQKGSLGTLKAVGFSHLAFLIDLHNLWTYRHCILWSKAVLNIAVKNPASSDFWEEVPIETGFHCVYSDSKILLDVYRIPLCKELLLKFLWQQFDIHQHESWSWLVLAQILAASTSRSCIQTKTREAQTCIITPFTTFPGLGFHKIYLSLSKGSGQFPLKITSALKNYFSNMWNAW